MSDKTTVYTISGKDYESIVDAVEAYDQKSRNERKRLLGLAIAQTMIPLTRDITNVTMRMEDAVDTLLVSDGDGYVFMKCLDQIRIAVENGHDDALYHLEDVGVRIGGVRRTYTVWYTYDIPVTVEAEDIEDAYRRSLDMDLDWDRAVSLDSANVYDDDGNFLGGY